VRDLPPLFDQFLHNETLRKCKTLLARFIPADKMQAIDIHNPFFSPFLPDFARASVRQLALDQAH